MTEAEWLTCADPKAMLDFLQGKASDRKLRLFAVACCRRIGNLVSTPSGQQAVMVAERFADGSASEEEASLAFDVAQADGDDLNSFSTRKGAPCLAAAYAAYPEDAMDAAIDSADSAQKAVNEPEPSAAPTERDAQCVLVRDIFGNPLCPIVVIRSWFSSAVLNLAQSIYDERAFERMPELADALERAGCANAKVMDHCRKGSDHVRGCWVLDVILEKT